MAGYEAELPIVIGSFGLYLAYHFWFFRIHGTGLRTTKMHSRDGREDMFMKGKVARIQFTDLVVRDNDTIVGIQQNRNGLTGVSFLAGVVSIMAQKILAILLDMEQQDTIRAFAEKDPLVSNVQTSPAVVLGVNFILLITSMLAFGQSVRMYIHAGYFFKAASMGIHLLTVADTAEVVIQAQVAQTIGMRLLFFFPVTAMWLIGPTAMLISAILTIGITAYLDFFFVADKTFIDLLLTLQQHRATTS